MECFIGCSGYFYWHWKDKFYPSEIKPNQFFKYYQNYFQTVEINSSFYNFPKKKTVERWYKDSEENFLFSVKVNKIITHIKKFSGTERILDEFYRMVGNLREKLACILFQLPPNLKFNMEKLEEIIGQMNKNFRNVLEFRHKSWWNKSVYEFLKENGICFCSISAKNLPDDLIKTTDYLYIRFHGREWYRYDYSDEELTEWGRKIKDSGAKKLYAYFNNDFNAHAVKNALKFREILQKNKVI